MPPLIGTKAQVELLKEEAKLKILTAFQNNYIKIKDKKYEIKPHISKERADKFVYNLEVSCPE